MVGAEFARKIETTVVRPVEFSIDDDVRASIGSSVSRSGVLLLGEIHGSEENVSVIRALMETFRIRRLALEWDQETGVALDEYLASGRVNMAVLGERVDGRVTSGHFALLRNMTLDGTLTELICVDRHTSDMNWQQRDETMAETVLGSVDEPLLVVAGNLHTALESVRLDDEFPNFQTMGTLIKAVRPDVASVKIVYGSGEYANLGTHSFDEESPLHEPRLTHGEAANYEFYIPVSHPATVPE